MVVVATGYLSINGELKEIVSEKFISTKKFINDGKIILEKIKNEIGNTKFNVNKKSFRHWIFDDGVKNIEIKIKHYLA